MNYKKTKGVVPKGDKEMGPGFSGPISYTGYLLTKFSPKTSPRLGSQELQNIFPASLIVTVFLPEGVNTYA